MQRSSKTALCELTRKLQDGVDLSQADLQLLEALTASGTSDDVLVRSAAGSPAKARRVHQNGARAVFFRVG